MPKLGVIVRSVREQRGLSQVELAQLSGVNQSYISRLENLTRDRVDAASLGAIARVLNVSVEELLIAAGILPAKDRVAEVRWKRLERMFRGLDNDRQQELLALANTLVVLQQKAEAPAIAEDLISHTDASDVTNT